IDNLAKENHWFLDVESIGVDGSVYFKRELAVYIKDLQDNLQEVRKKRRSGSRRYKRIRRSRRSDESQRTLGRRHEILPRPDTGPCDGGRGHLREAPLGKGHGPQQSREPRLRRGARPVP